MTASGIAVNPSMCAVGGHLYGFFMDISAFIIACVRAVMAVLSLGWQIAAWLMVGRRSRRSQARSHGQQWVCRWISRTIGQTM